MTNILQELVDHFDSLPKLEQLVGRLEDVVKQLEPVAELVAPSSAKTDAKIVADVAAGGQIADAAISTAETDLTGGSSEQAKAEAAASVTATKVPEAGSDTGPSYTAAEWKRIQEAEASTAATKVAEPAPAPAGAVSLPEPPAPSPAA